MFARNKKTHRLVALLALSTVTLAPAISLAWESAPAALDFSERLVAGGPHDFMTVHHLKMRGTQRAIGRKLAEIAQSRHSLRPATIDADLALRRRDFYQANYPLHLQRAMGVADHFEMKLGDSGDVTVLPYNVPAAPGCSVVYYPPSHVAGGHAMLSRNYDFTTGTWQDLLGDTVQDTGRKTTEDPYVIEVYPDNGFASLYLCVYELLGGCFDGVNEHGLTVALLANNDRSAPTPSITWQPGLSELEIARYVLDTCRTADEAREALAAIDFYYMLVPCHYIIGDRDGHSFVWEYPVNRRRRYVTEGDGGPQWVTNHPIHRRAYPTVESIPKELTSSTFARFRRLNDEINKAPTKRTLEDIKNANHCVRATGGAAAVPGRTLWHALYDCTENSLAIDFYLGEGDPPGQEKRSGYIQFKLEH